MQLNKKNELLIRVYIVVFGFALFSLLLFSRAFKISYIEGDKWRARGDSLSMAYFPVSADRGNIYSDNGSLLAASIPYFELRMDLKADGLKEETFNEGVDSLAWNLSKTVMKDKTPEQVKNYLIRKRNAGDRYMLLAKKVNYEELEQIREFPILRKGQFRGGFIVKRHFTRFKPYGSLASRTIGLSRANAQSVGLEKFFDDHLKGEEGQKLMQRVGGGVWIPLNEHDEVKPRRGADVKTTINVDFQDIAHGALKRSILHHQADWGVAVIMEVETGKVKAIVNLNRDGEQAWESYNHAIGTRTEPGSTMKMASVMTFMEDGIARPETMLPVYKGRTRICNNPLNDSEHHDLDEMSLQDVFEASSNVGIAKFAHANYGSDEGAKKFINRLKQYGLSVETGIEIEGEKEPYIKNPGDHSQLWSCTSIPWMSIGYEVLLTPLQSLAFYNAVANDGKYMNPYLVESIVKGDKVIEEFSPDVKIEQIASWSTIQNIRKMMEGVVLRGTADDVKSDLFDFAGKTGTSRIDYGKGSTGPKKYQASFIGYFPVKQPKYTCIVLVNNPRKNGYYGSVVAGTVFREVAQKILAISPEIRIAKAEEQPEFRASNLAYVQGAKNELEILCSAMNIPLNITTENDYTVLMPANENGLELQGRNIKTDIIPDVKGMSLSQAIHILENQGLTINIKGAGRILSQSIRPGTAAKGQQVILRLG